MRVQRTAPPRPGLARGGARAECYEQCMSSMREKTKFVARNPSVKYKNNNWYVCAHPIPEKSHDIGIVEDTRAVGVEDGLLPPARDGAVSQGELKIHWLVGDGAGA